MSYVTYDYYNSVFLGESVDDADFPGLLSRASEIVEEMCMYRISETNFQNYDAETQSRVKKAVCAQIEYLDANGGGDLDMGNDFQSAGLGKFNYTKASSADGTSQSIYSPRALRYLIPTGLLYRGGY